MQIFFLMLGLHYVPEDHGDHVLDHRIQNGMDVRQCGVGGWGWGRGGQT